MQDITNRVLSSRCRKTTKFVFTPKSSKKKSKKKKPGWDDSVSDLSKYKLTPEELQRKKMSFLSPHNVLTKSKKKTKQLTTKHVQDKLRALKSRQSRKQRTKKKEPSSLDLLIEDSSNSSTDVQVSDTPSLEVISLEREIEELNNNQEDEDMFNEMEALLKDADISSVHSWEEEEDEEEEDEKSECQTSYVSDNDDNDSIDSESFNTTVTEGEEDEEDDNDENVQLRKNISKRVKSTDLDHLIEGLEVRLQNHENRLAGKNSTRSKDDEDISEVEKSIAFASLMQSKDEEEEESVVRLLGVCNRLVKNLEKTTMMQQQQQEIILGVQLEADRYKRHCNDLKRELVEVKETIDSKMKNIEKVVVVASSATKNVATTKETTSSPAVQTVPTPRPQRLPKPVRSPHLVLGRRVFNHVKKNTIYSRKAEFESVDLRAHRALNFRSPPSKPLMSHDEHKKKKKPTMSIKFKPVVHF
jgi:hypothetical protein